MFPRFMPMMMCGFGLGSGRFADKVLGEYMPPAFLRKHGRLAKQKNELSEEYDKLRKELQALIDEVKRDRPPQPDDPAKREYSPLDHREAAYTLSEYLLCREMTFLPVSGEDTIVVCTSVGTSQADKFKVTKAQWKKLQLVIDKGRLVFAKLKKVGDEYDKMATVKSRFEDDAYSAIVNWEQEESMRQVIRSHRGGAKAIRGMFAAALAKSKQEKKKN